MAKRQVEPKPRRPAVLADRASFEADARPVLAALSQAFRRLIAECPGEPIERAAHLQRALDVDYTLAWRVFTVATADDPVSTGADAPLPGQVERLLESAAKRRINASILERVRRSYAAFEHLVQRHAGEATPRGRGGGKRVGGRALFNSLIVGSGAGPADRQDQVHRRSTFQGLSHLWGLQTHVNLLCCVFNGTPNTPIDALMLTGYVGIHTLRKDVPFRILANAGSYDAGDPNAADKPMRAFSEERILERFSTKPLPKLETSQGIHGMIETAVRFDGIGKANAIDIFTVQAMDDAYQGKPQPWFGATRGISVPSELMILDVLVARGLTDPATLRASTHGSASMYESLVPRIQEFQLPFKEEARYLGTDLAAIESTAVPRYPEMIRHVLRELTWHETEFDIYRVQARYPLMHSLIHMQADAVKS